MGWKTLICEKKRKKKKQIKTPKNNQKLKESSYIYVFYDCVHVLDI